MNLLLSDDYLLQDYPEYITNTIRSGHSTCLRFNRKGDYLASGRGDGTVVIWDIDTMGVARKLRGHSKNIASLSWSSCGRYLLSACQGWKAILWDLKDGRRHREVRFRAPVYIADLHPSNQYVCYLLRTRRACRALGRRFANTIPATSLSSPFTRSRRCWWTSPTPSTSSTSSPRCRSERMPTWTPRPRRSRPRKTRSR
ncbi:hypothetical protein IMZ48_42140 [Candidatus Bathyarchaeota archaeon]|nr:hypothetical protein [Candidatus Bathyarchaeota archaeon]